MEKQLYKINESRVRYKIKDVNIYSVRDPRNVVLVCSYW